MNKMVENLILRIANTEAKVGVIATSKLAIIKAQNNSSSQYPPNLLLQP